MMDINAVPDNAYFVTANDWARFLNVTIPGLDKPIDPVHGDHRGYIVSKIVYDDVMKALGKEA